MSKTIDQRVVEMRFDNSHFEKNVSTTMSTLDKLKSKLNFSNSAKGLEEVNAAAKKVDMNGFASGIHEVHNRFTALQIAGVTCMQRITNAALTAGKNIINSLAIQPVTTGFNEYELKMGSVQTIMASTGETLETVNEYLEELNAYSDQTIYSFSDMTQNIGKFTNAGVKLKDAVAAIKGISNEAALAGANSNEASRAMYNFAQALSSGYVKLIDWKSIENANMATVSFKEELIKTAVELGTLKKVTDGYKTSEDTVITATKNFNDSLQDQWMTSDVLIATLQKYADTTTEIGQKATQAATEVKTFSQMMDTLKESAQSGWAQSWEIIFGDFNEGKTLWTSVSEAIGGIIDTLSKNRNNWLIENLTNDSKWDRFNEQLSKAGVSSEKLEETLIAVAKENGIAVDDLIEKYGTFKKVISAGKIPIELFVKALRQLSGSEDGLSMSTEDLNEKLEKFQKIVDQVWRGDYKDGKERIEALTKAGYDYAEVQALVNKTVDGHKLTLEDLTDTQLKNVGYTEEQIKMIRELADEAEKAGTPLNELIESLSKPAGRDLLIDSFKKLWEEINKVGTAIGTAWETVFGGDPTEGFTFYNAIEEFKKLTDSMTFTEEHATRVTNILTGVFSALDITWSLASKTFFGGLKILNEILKLIGTDVGKILEYVANKITEFNNWIEHATIFGSNTKWKDLAKIFIAIYNGIKKVITGFLELDRVEAIIKNFKDMLKDLFNVDGIIEFTELFSLDSIVNAINDLFTKIETWVKSMDEPENIAMNIIEGLCLGLIDGITYVGKAIGKVVSKLISSFCELLGIHSPSTVFMTLGGFIIAGLAKGLENNLGWIWDIFKNLGSGLALAFEGIAQNGIPFIVEATRLIANAFMKGLSNINAIDFGSLFIMAGFTSFIVMFSKLVKVIEKFANPLDKLADTIKSAKGVFDQLKETIESVGKAKSLELRSKALLNLAMALGLLVAALIALSYVKSENLWECVGIIAVLSGILIALTLAMNKLNSASVSLTKEGVEVGGFKTGLLAIVGSLAVLALVVKIVGSMDTTAAKRGFAGLTGLVVGLVGLMAAYGFLIKGKAAQNIDKAGIMMMKMAGALLVMSLVVKILSSVAWGDMGKAGVGILGFVGIVYLLNTIGQTPSKGIDKLGGLMLKISAALILMVAAVKLISFLSWEEMAKAGAGMLGFMGVVGLLVAIDSVFGGAIGKVGATLASIAGSMLFLAIAGKVMATMKWEDMFKAIVGLGGLMIVVTLLTKITQIAYKDAPKIGVCLLTLSIALGILAGVSAILGMVDPENLWRGVAAMGALSVMMSAMIWATRGANDVKGNLIVMSAAIAVMAVAIAALSTISPEQLKPAVESMAVVMGMFAVITKMSSNIKSSIATLAIMAGAVALIGYVIYKLAEVDTGNTLDVSLGLAAVIVAFGAALKLCNGLGGISLSAVGAMASMLVVVGLLGLVLGGLSNLDIYPSLETAAALSVLLIAMAGVCHLLSPLAAMGINVIAGAGVLAAVSLILGGVILALAKLATTALPGMAEDLSDFMEKLTPFLDGVQKVDENMIKGIDALVEVMYAFIAVGQAGYGMNENVIKTFGDSIVTLAEDLGEFAKNLGNFDEATLTSVEWAAKIIETLANAAGSINGQSGFSKWLFGDNSLTLFVQDFGSIAEDIKDFTSKTKDLTDEDVDTVKRACDIVIAISKAGSKIDGQSSLGKAIFGDNSLSLFVENLGTVGTKIKEFVANIGKFDDKTVTTVECAGDAIVALTNAASKINGQSEKSIEWFGDNSLKTFAGNLPVIGTNLAEFATNLGAFSKEQVSSVKCAGDVIVALAEAGSNIDGQSDWAKKIFGDNGLGAFSTGLPAVASNLRGFVDNLGVFGGDQIASVNTAVEIIKSLSSLGQADISSLSTYLPLFGQYLKGFAEDLVSFCNSITSLDSGTVAEMTTTLIEMVDGIASDISDNTSSLIQAGRDIVTAINSGIKESQDSINTTTEGVVNKSAKTIESSNEAYKTAGKTLGEALSKGIADKEESIEKAAAKIAKAAATAIGSKETQDDFKNAGKELGEGLVLGINSKKQDAYDAGFALGQEAVKGERDGQKSQSPSKETYQSGIWLGEGLVNGMIAMGKKVYTAGVNVGTNATSAISSAMSKIADVVNMDVDAQPTIRPIVDLSNIETGANAINNMLEMSPSVSALANVGATNSMMNQRIQNGRNADVVSAINKLNNKLDNVGGTSYNINGITYDDGSNISDAIKTLVRAVTIEGRT